MANITWLFGVLKFKHGLRPVQHFDFLALPSEVRKKIYQFTLTTDLPVLDRQHSHDCSWCKWEPHELQDMREVYNPRKMPGCNCQAREGLAILLVNRQINKEAAPIFWGENHFSFGGIDAFIHLVGRALRPQYRQMIPHITIYSNPRGFTTNPPVPPIRLWGVLFQCKPLRTLEFPRYQRFLPQFTGRQLLDTELVSWAHLRSELPNLKMFSWSFFLRCSGPGPRRPDGSLPCEFEYRVKISKSLDLTIWSPKEFKLYGPFEREDVDFGDMLRRRAFPRGPQYPVKGDELVSTGREDEYRCAAAVVGGHNTLDVTRPGAIPTTWMVKHFIVPLGPEKKSR